MLDNFALLSGQISSLHRLLKNDKMPDLRNRVFFPCQLCADRDEELEVCSLNPNTLSDCIELLHCSCFYRLLRVFFEGKVSTCVI